MKRLLCSLVGHAFAAPPGRIAEYLHGDCARCKRYVLALAARPKTRLGRLRAWALGR